MSDERRPTYLEVGDDGVTRRIWRASSLGACDRSLVMHALEHATAPTPAAIQRAYDAGHDAEDEILRAGDAKGWRMLGEGEVWQQYGHYDESGQLCVEVKCGKVGGVEQVIRCHPDGIALKYKRWPLKGEDENGTKRVAEAKFLRRGSPYTSVAKARSSRFYSWQTSVEMHATGLGLLMLVGWKVKDEETGEEKVEGVDIETFDDPMYKLGEVKRRVIQLARLITRAEDEGLGVVECDWAMYPCAFYETHDGQKVWAKTRGELDLGKDDEIKVTAIAGRVEKARMMKDRYEKQRKEAAEELREVLSGLGGVRSNVYEVGDFVLEWRYTPAKEAEEKVVQYKAKKESEVLVVKQKKQAAGGGVGDE